MIRRSFLYILAILTLALVIKFTLVRVTLAACSGTITCYQDRSTSCPEGYEGPKTVPPCSYDYSNPLTDSCGDWAGNGGCIEPPFGFCYQEVGSCSTGGGGNDGGGISPNPTPAPGGSGECSSGNLCFTTWSGLCCDSGCAHTWEEGYNACVGGGGGGGGDPDPEPFSCTEYTTCPDGRKCAPGKKCVDIGGGSYRCEVKQNCVRCTVSLAPDPLQITTGSTLTAAGILTKKVPDDVRILGFRFNTTNDKIAKPTNEQANNRTYTSDIKGLKEGTVTIGLRIDLDYNVSCEDSIVATVTQPGPWWQVVDGDVTTSGSLISNIPTTCGAPNCAPVLVKPGSGGYPGVASYRSSYDFSAGTGQGSASAIGWLAQSGYITQTYSYEFFANLIPKDTVFNPLSSSSVSSSELSSGATVSSDGFFWYKHSGDLTINSTLTMPSNRKVVLLVEGGNLNLGGNVLVNNSNSLFFAVVGKTDGGQRGNISLSTTTNRVEGLYLTEGSFQTGISGQQLNVRGSIAALNGMFLQRDLGANNSNTPSHVFTFEPIFMFVFPKSLSQYEIRWQEVSP